MVGKENMKPEIEYEVCALGVMRNLEPPKKLTKLNKRIYPPLPNNRDSIEKQMMAMTVRSGTMFGMEALVTNASAQKSAADEWTITVKVQTFGKAR